MKILVYGAGVLGCNLARNLLRAGKDVTLLARGNWAAEIKQNGLRIKDKFSPRTSVSRIPVVTELAPDATYDVIFVVLRYTQLDSVLYTLRANRTKNIVFVGNNVQARALAAALPGKNVLFAFALSAGHRESDRVVSIDLKKITIGQLRGAVSNAELIGEIFGGTKYKVVYEPNMEDYLLCHAAFVMPAAFACYKTDGNLKKRWKIIDGKRCLIKGGSNPFRQQPFNEAIASGIMERLGIPHVSYTVIWSKDAPYSVCEDFVTENTELIPAWRLLQAKKQKNSTSRYRHLLECCELLGIGNITPFLDRMLVLDYIIANEDRHFNNFGALRNAETLEWLGMAPIYDSGSSLGYDKMPGQMRSEKDVVCKPFKNHHAEQLKLVTDFDWIDFDCLSDVDELISSVLSCEEAADYIDEGRIHAITESVQRRIGHLQELAMTQTPQQLDTTEDDVREEVAADYAPKMEL